MSTPLRFNISCDGEFTIDEKGIRSRDPISVKSSGWNWWGNTFTLECNNTNTNSTIVSSNFGSTVVTTNSSYIYVNGHKVDVPQNKSESKVFNEEFNFNNPVLEELKTTGPAIHNVDLPLASDSKLRINGSGSINIRGKARSSNCNIHVTGSGAIYGNYQFDNLKASLTGSGSIFGFKIDNNINANVTGSGSIQLKSQKGCRVSKSVIGSGYINAKE